MAAKKGGGVRERERRYLDRLETLVDSIYALVIVIIVAGFPSAREFEGEFSSAWDFLSRHSDELVAPGLGLVLIIMYWAQSNVQLGSLVRTDSKHATLVIVQVLLLLTYVYSVDFVLDFPEDTNVLTAQSVIFFLMGVVAFAAWSWAVRGRRLVSDEITDDELFVISRGMLPEPVTAFITIWVSFLGSTAWELAWLAYLPIAYFAKRIQKPPTIQISES
ncbi:MAG: hypothetical protein WBG93_05615 [Thermoanaerobaculia bacterium]